MNARRLTVTTLAALCALATALLLFSAAALAQREHTFSSSFGSPGSGEGQLSRPGQLAVNEETGDVYVVDRGNQRVEIFSSSGVYISQFDGSAAPTGAFSWPSRSDEYIQGEGGIAVDNSKNPLDPSKGDVYVVDQGHSVIDKFSASGAYIGQITGTPSKQFSEYHQETVNNIAVDPNGAFWAIEAGNGSYLQFNDAVVNEYVSYVPAKLRGRGGLSEDDLGGIGFAFNSEGDFYAGFRPVQDEIFTLATEFTNTGEELVEKIDGEATSALAVDLSSNGVYLDHESSIAAYTPKGTSIERFGSPQLEQSEGIAVDSSTGTVYASNAAGQAIDVFTAFVVPDVTSSSATGFSETAATVGGVVDPDGLPVTSCVFEYATSSEYAVSNEYTHSEPCASLPGPVSEPVAVSARLSGLEPLTEYHYRLKASNANGSNVGQDKTFVTPQPVGLAEESVSDVSSSSALFSAQIDPGGADTTYHFEYGTSTSYGESVPTPAGEVGTGTSGVPVSVRAQDLDPETTYHVRVVANNVLGTVYGPDLTFTTEAGVGMFGLPDNRQWELVSPPNKQGALLLPIQGEKGGLIEASVEGSAVSYLATGPLGAGTVGNPTPTRGAQILSRRGPGGWSSQDIADPIKKPAEPYSVPEYAFFSSDLSEAIVERHKSEPLSAEVTETTPYLHDIAGGSYLPLVTPNDVTPLGIEYGPISEAGEDDEAPTAVAATSDLSHVLFTSPYALAGNAHRLNGEFYKENGESWGKENIYEWSGGQLQLVNVLPDGAASAGATLGGTNGDERDISPRHELSSDGSRVFFQAPPKDGLKNSFGLYMRNMLTDETVQADAPAPGVSPQSEDKAYFQIASTDGSEVFFLDEQPLTLDSKLIPPGESSTGIHDLYVYDTTTGSLTDLSVDPNAGEEAEVKAPVVGASEDGSIVYFVANGKLAAGATQGNCHRGSAPEPQNLCNLYVESKTGSTWSPPRLVAILSEEDGPDWATSLPGSSSLGEEMSKMVSRVSSNGRYVVFMSQRSLTGYDNRDAISGEPDEEVFLYDEMSGKLKCLSCNPSDARPVGIFDTKGDLLVDPDSNWSNHWLAASVPAWTGPFYASRDVSNEGRVFFDSAEAIVPQDTNGREDVYEYEPEGVGNCTRAEGCVSLISSGTSGEESAFLDASAKGPGGQEGEDVFFLTASRLVPQDLDSAFDVYDAHVCSASAPCLSAPVSSPPCTSGDSCKAAPSPQPAIFGAPPSATFNGAGDVVPVPAATVKQKGKTAAQLRAEKLAKALRACRKRAKGKRAACEAQARKRYGPKKSESRKSSFIQGGHQR